jgi:hypothetical protein
LPWYIERRFLTKFGIQALCGGRQVLCGTKQGLAGSSDSPSIFIRLVILFEGGMKDLGHDCVQRRQTQRRLVVVDSSTTISAILMSSPSPSSTTTTTNATKGSLKRQRHGLGLQVSLTIGLCFILVLGFCRNLTKILRQQETTRLRDHGFPSHRMFLTNVRQPQKQVPIMQQYTFNHSYQRIDLLLYGPETIQQRSQTTTKAANATNTATTKTTPRGYLVFRPPLQAAQGIGNLLHGLLAVHYLGIEFHWHVCLLPEDWPDFFQAFQPSPTNHSEINDEMMHSCKTIKLQHPSTPRNTLWLVNFAKIPMNECDLKHRLEEDEPILYIVANTYPRWPSLLATNTTPGTTSIGVTQAPISSSSIRLGNVSFHDYYQPTPALLKLLPWHDDTNNDETASSIEGAPNPSKSLLPPTTVVHLRQADGIHDARAGLDAATLDSLGQTLPSSTTFLVTNQIDYYQYFEQNFGWRHPNWATAIRHSALPNVKWSPLAMTMSHSSTSNPRRNIHNRSNDHIVQPQSGLHSQQRQNQGESLSSSSSSSPMASLQMWSDWYTLLQAKRVYHTHSDFSLSAAHWNRNGQQASYTIRGIDTATKRLGLSLPPWVYFPTAIHTNNNRFLNQPQEASFVLSLSDRTMEQLLHCDLHPSGLNDISNVLHLDDEYHG